MNRIHRLCQAVSIVALVAGINADPLYAQESGTSDDTGSNVIIVTAQKREQSLQDVPSSIAAIGSQNIAETGKDGFADFINTVPSLSVASGGPGLSTLAIRGVTTGGVRNDEPQNKETVGVYIDDTPISVNGFNPDLGLFDIARIEVLRGPQGTLYGSGSLGGTIRIITNHPDLSSIETMGEGSLSVTRKGGANYDLRGMINLPLVNDSLAIRAIAYRSELDGYIDNPATGQKNVNDAQTTGARVQLGAQLSERLRANLAFMLHDLKTGSRSDQYAPYERTTQAFDGLSDNIKVYSGSLSYELDGATITSATSYLDKRNVNRISLEFLLSAALAYDSPSPLVDTTGVREFSQELRIASDGSGPANYVVGVFYQHRKRDYTQDGLVPGIDAYVGVPSTALGTPSADQAFYGTQNIRQTQWAGFGELSYELTPGMVATVGLRAFTFKEDYETYSSGLFNGGVSQSAGAFDEDGITPKFNLSYTFDRNHMVYAQVSKGFRLGGVNTTVPADLCAVDLAALGRSDSAESFDSDSVWNYEIGTKNQSADGSFTFNASGYYIKWQDIQTTLSLPSCQFSFRTNAGSSRSIGLELEASVRPAPRTEFYATLGLTDSQLTEDVPFTTWQSGDSVPAVSPVQVSLGARQGFSLFGTDDSYARIDYNFVSKAHTQFDQQDPTNREFNDYSLLNLAVGFQIPNSPFEFSVYARNLLDSDGRIARQPGSIVAPESYITVRPRTLGATLRANF